jgi:hypothetical protein
VIHRSVLRGGELIQVGATKLRFRLKLRRPGG